MFLWMKWCIFLFCFPEWYNWVWQQWGDTSAEPQITSFAELCCVFYSWEDEVVAVLGGSGRRKQYSHNWANEAYHAHSLCICHFLQDFSFFDFFEALRHSSHANNRLVHQLSPPLELIGAVQREPESFWSRAVIRSVDADCPQLAYNPLICTHSPSLFHRPTCSHSTPPPTERTLPFTVPWRLLRRSWEGRPASFHIYASDAAVISLWLDSSPPRPQEEPGDCPPAATVFCFHPDTGI